ncbi:MBL fold metallo-hydrolase [Methanocella sp. CWC-04]|uniref:MBL fold metallo-hydrolase n=1 Tax=Methanooceanicella nereidis TaxID=2052831 RepID=A0AAP2RBW2_9EURY|nr:ribonuclease Z [Methanocella sp. CWC-04]MCD1294664.1 MBL fold metallo-hydrolase [Methanocella sp. CWC-04]
MRVVFLGTNGWYDTKTGNTLCTLIEAGDKFIVLDAGNGIHKLNRHIPREDARQTFLFLSHFHLDHVEGLHTLNKSRLSKGLKIYGQEGTRSILNYLMNDPFSVPLSDMPYPVSINELPENRHDVPFLEDFRFLLHSSRCLGYRFNIEGKIVAYCTDTGICDNLIELAKDADLLITECSFRFGQHSDHWPHLNPVDAVNVAKKANVKKMALVHFDANRYPELENRKEVYDRMIKEFDGLIVSYDDMEIEI